MSKLINELNPNNKNTSLWQNGDLFTSFEKVCISGLPFQHNTFLAMAGYVSEWDMKIMEYMQLATLIYDYNMARGDLDEATKNQLEVTFTNVLDHIETSFTNLENFINSKSYTAAYDLLYKTYCGTDAHQPPARRGYIFPVILNNSGQMAVFCNITYNGLKVAWKGDAAGIYGPDRHTHHEYLRSHMYDSELPKLGSFNYDYYRQNYSQPLTGIHSKEPVGKPDWRYLVNSSFFAPHFFKWDRFKPTTHLLYPYTNLHNGDNAIYHTARLDEDHKTDHTTVTSFLQSADNARIAMGVSTMGQFLKEYLVFIDILDDDAQLKSFCDWDYDYLYTGLHRGYIVENTHRVKYASGRFLDLKTTYDNTKTVKYSSFEIFHPEASYYYGTYQFKDKTFLALLIPK